MVTWIPSIYPLYVSIYTNTMDPMGNVLFLAQYHPFHWVSLTGKTWKTHAGSLDWVSDESCKQILHHPK